MAAGDSRRKASEEDAAKRRNASPCAAKRKSTSVSKEFGEAMAVKGAKGARAPSYRGFLPTPLVLAAGSSATGQLFLPGSTTPTGCPSSTGRRFARAPRANRSSAGPHSGIPLARLPWRRGSDPKAPPSRSGSKGPRVAARAGHRAPPATKPLAASRARRLGGAHTPRLAPAASWFRPAAPRARDAPLEPPRLGRTAAGISSSS